MISEEQEFLISQHADGMLDPARAAEVESLLSRDAEARAVWLAHRRVNQIVRAGTSMPELDWDRLAGMISTGIEQADAAERERVYRLPVGRWAARAVAVAALLTIGLFVHRAGEVTPPDRPVLARVMQVEIAPVAPASEAAPVVQVAIVPEPAAPGSGLDRAYFDPWGVSGVRIVVAAGPRSIAPDPFDSYGY